jgi:choline dehydrogenase-like flavoprotein
MSERVVIVGGGVSGLVASWAFAQRGQRSVILEPGTVGGEFLSGGLKYIHASEGMVELFDGLDLPHSDYKIIGGILLRDRVKPYPKCFKGMEPQEAARIRADHYRKTRRAQPGDGFAAAAMNDPAAVESKHRAIRCDFKAMIQELDKRANVLRLGLKQIDSARSAILLSNGEWVSYTKLVVTIPLWAVRNMADFYVPQGVAMGLNLIQVRPHKDDFARWDYVYTPYTPADAVHRFSPAGGGYSCEVNGDWERQAESVKHDLAFIFNGGYLVEDIKTGLKGHLLELPEQPAWPENIRPLGRFAKWNPRATMDVTLLDAKSLAEEWFS